MSTYVEQTFEGQFEVDGHRFERCTFRDAVLVYRGGPKPDFRKCNLVRSIFAFEGPAGNTLTLLQDFSRRESGFQKLVRRWLPALFPNKRQQLLRSRRQHGDSPRLMSAVKA